MKCDALYLHVPFCVRKCPYCDFYSVPATEKLLDDYVDAVLCAVGTVPFVLDPLDTVYFGGGTPSLLGGERIAAILAAVRERFGIASSAEITVECNPHSTLAQDLETMQRAGVNRLSFGLQSADDAQLKLLGRLHSATDAADAARMAGALGFSVSLDLMLATPGQSFADIDTAVKLCAETGADHVSAYLLKVEEGTPFDRQGIAAHCPDADAQADYYQYAVQALARQGYAQYEISNFARGGKVARHNRKYWLCEEYLGIGPSAHSFIGGRRRYFARDLAGFLAAADIWSLLQDDGAGGDAQEWLMLRLRLREGVRFAALLERYPKFDLDGLRQRAGRLPEGLAELDDDGLRLTAEGFLLSNAILGELLE